MIDSKYLAAIPVLWVEDDKKIIRAMLPELLKRQICVHHVDNLKDAVDVLKSVKVDLLVSDGLYPRVKGGKEAKGFMLLIEKIAAMKKAGQLKNVPRLIAWSNSTGVHEYCHKQGMEAYSKFPLTKERFKEKGRKFIRVKALEAERMAETVGRRLKEIYGLKKAFGGKELSFYYREPGTVLALALAADMRTAHFARTVGMNYKPMVTLVDKGEVSVYMDEGNDAVIARKIYRKFCGKGYFEKFEKRVRAVADDLLKEVRPFVGKNFKAVGNKQLASLYKEFCDGFISMRVYTSMPTALEHGTNMWTGKLMEILKRKIADEGERNSALSILTSPEQDSYVQEFDLKLAGAAILNKYRELLRKLAKDYAWIRYAFQGEPLKVTDLEERIKQIGKTRADFESFIKRGRDRITVLRGQKRELVKKYGLTLEEKRWFDIGAKIVFIKFFRKGVFAESYYAVEFLLKEIGRRVGCTRDQVTNMTPGEVLAALKTGCFDPKLVELRKNHSLLAHVDGRTFFVPVENELIQGKDFFRLKDEKVVMQTEIKGQTAFSGFATGRVKIVNVPADMQNFKQGDILISRSTNPSLLMAMRRAAAFVTDLGGLTCHAAIVARELKIPCVVGTKVATQVFKDGDMVEVDAGKGLVRKAG